MAKPTAANLKISSSAERQDLIRVLHTERRMKVYGVTENELRTLTLINIAVAALFSLGTGFLAFGLDLHKDLLLTDALPEKALVLRELIRPAAFLTGGIFYFIGIVVWCFRGNFLSTIKRESSG